MSTHRELYPEQYEHPMVGCRNDDPNRGRLPVAGDVVAYWVWTGGEEHAKRYARVQRATPKFLTVRTEDGTIVRRGRDFFSLVTDPAEYEGMTFGKRGEKRT